MTRISNFCPPFPSGSRSRLRCIVVLHGIRGVSSKTHFADLRRFLRKARIYWALSKCHSGQTITFHFSLAVCKSYGLTPLIDLTVWSAIQTRLTALRRHHFIEPL